MHNIKIKGNLLPITFAKFVYRCEECLGPLKRRDFGLVCAGQPDEHRGFIHRDQAAEIEAGQAELLARARQDFIICNGKIAPREDPIKNVERP
jgi:hypothetical protein